MSERGASVETGPLHAYWRAIVVLVAALLSAGVLVALIVTLGNANRERDQALGAQSRSYEVMILTRRLSDTMARAEATLGRFVISGDMTLGQLFSEQWLRAGAQIDRLDSITNDNPVQQGRVFALRQAYRERGEELSLIARSTQYRKNDQALARYYQARDAAALQRIDTLLDGFISTERNLLDARTAEANATIEWSNFAAKVFAVFGGLLVLATIAFGWFAVRESSARARAAAEAEAERLRAGALEAAVAVATDELHAESREREAAEAKLRQMQKLEAVGQLTGGIAHDFNNMLAVVLGGIELARRRAGDGPDEVVRHLDSAAEGANRASALTRRLLAFARAEPLLPQSVDPGAVLRDMSDLLDRTLGDAIRVDASGVRPCWPVWVDRDGLENAILNLAVNARDAMDGRGRLTIATGNATLADNEVGHCAAGDYATVAIGDSGCGMAPEVLERVFEPFFTTKPVGKGTGLGLSQVFGFARQSLGEVGIASTPGQGTVVTIYLPRHVAADAVPAAPAPAPAAAPETPPAADGLDILVVEDDQRVLAATIALLRELGHRPVACADSTAAAAAAAAMPALDLVLSDVLMPGKTGPELIAELSASLPGVAALFVTGYAGDTHEAEGFGDHAVLRKPFTIAGLAAAIDRVMAGRAVSAPVAAAG